MTTAQYGSWTSPIGIDLITGSSVGLGGGVADDGDVYWVESHADQGGRASLWVRRADGSRFEITPGLYVRSTVHEYGGGAWTLRDGVAVVSAFPSNVLYVVEEGAAPRPITPEGPFRYAAMALVPGSRDIVAVREDHTDSDIDCLNTLVVLGLDDTNDDGGRVIASGADFYGPPAVARDGQVAWHEWDHPNMPWDTTRIMVGSLDGAEPFRVAGGEDESVVHPAWTPSGALVFLSDATGFWNFRRWSGGEITALHDHPYEFCGPAWMLNGAPYVVLDDDRLGCSWLVDGFARVGILEGGELRDFDLPAVAAEIGGGSPRGVVQLGFADRTGGLFTIDWESGATEEFRSALAVDLDPAYVSVAQARTWESPDGVVHGWYYPPVNGDFAAPADELPPLMVTSHGGPTSFAPPVLALGRQYWTSRGIGVLDVNYGGSTGYGRDYRNRLKGAWGIVDVRDCALGAEALAAAGLADPERLAISGGSAGGYTTLEALAQTDTFAAGITRYGVTDLEALATDTHKFESRYLDGLIAPYPEGRQVYLDRSPLSHLAAIATPMLILQGEDDRVVPPSQAEQLAAAVRAQGLPVAYLLFPGEGHGFRKAGTIRAALEAELSFLGQVFGFHPSDDIAPLAVENLSPPPILTS